MDIKDAKQDRYSTKKLLNKAFRKQTRQGQSSGTVNSPVLKVTELPPHLQEIMWLRTATRS